jgi:hypothetical protein
LKLREECEIVHVNPVTPHGKRPERHDDVRRCGEERHRLRALHQQRLFLTRLDPKENVVL